MFLEAEVLEAESASEGVEDSFEITDSIVIRRNFPESWIWDSFSNNGCVDLSNLTVFFFGRSPVDILSSIGLFLFSKAYFF